MEDNMILDMFFARDEKALEAAASKYGRRLFRMSNNVLHNKEDSDECVNDTLMKAWEVIPPSRPLLLGAFLAKISRNMAINKWKAKSAVRRGGGEVDIILSELQNCIKSNKSEEPEQAYEASLTTDAINSFLASMEQTARVTFVLRYFHGESISDICERFGITESKAKSMLFRARKKLAVHLEKEGINL